MSLYITAYKGSNQKRNNKSKIVDGGVGIESSEQNLPNKLVFGPRLISDA